MKKYFSKYIKMFGLNLFIKSLYRYNYIDYNLFNLFNRTVYNWDKPNFRFEVSEFYHDNKILLEQVLKSKNTANYFIDELIGTGCISISLLKFISENIDVSIIKHKPYYNFDLALPFNIIKKKYKNEILGPNKLYVKCNDKFSEEFINIFFFFFFFFRKICFCISNIKYKVFFIKFYKFHFIQI